MFRCRSGCLFLGVWRGAGEINVPTSFWLFVFGCLAKGWGDNVPISFRLFVFGCLAGLGG